MKESAPHPEGVRYPPHLAICKACANWLKAKYSAENKVARAPRTIRAFVKARGRGKYVLNPRLGQKCD